MQNVYRRRGEIPVLISQEAGRLAWRHRFEGGTGEQAEVFVYLAAARYLRKHCSSGRNLAAEPPDDVQAVLQSLAVVLANPPGAEAIEELSRLVSAFDADDSPDPVLVAQVSRSMGDRIKGVQTTVRGLTRIALLALLVAATFFALLGIKAVK